MSWSLQPILQTSNGVLIQDDSRHVQIVADVNCYYLNQITNSKKIGLVNFSVVVVMIATTTLEFYFWKKVLVCILS